MSAVLSTTPTETTPASARQGIIQWASQEFGVEAGKVLGILKATCFRASKRDEPPASDAEVAALLIVSRAYRLNPFLRQIYAFKDKRGGIVPVVGVDGWAKLVNDESNFDGVEFEYDYKDQTKAKINSVTAIIYRKDRKIATKVTEFHAECVRETDPWKTSPIRMLRHKAFIQCARLAFSFSGIYDDDEAGRIVEGQVLQDGLAPPLAGELLPAEDDGVPGAPQQTATAALAQELTTKAKAELRPSETAPWKTPTEIKALIKAAGSLDQLNVVLNDISILPDTPERAQLMREWNAAVVAKRGPVVDDPEATARKVGEFVDAPKKPE